jgi:Protein of unknown function (DUF3300)
MNLIDTICRRRVNWKLSVIILLSAFLPGSLRAQAPPPPPPAEAAQSAPQKLPQEALNQLLAPIALYPDALVALILPASTVPSDLVLAARYLSANGDPAQVANQPWDDSVKSLVRYPDVVKWMDQNLEWTTQVGEAFLDQPADVMNTIQQLRAQAIAAGNLVDSPQQRIVKEEDCIRIVPTEPEVIYVPRYDPDVVYVRPYAPNIGPALTFGVGFAVGSWLNYDFDWPGRRVFVGDWNPGWKRDWKRDRDDGRDTINVVNIDRNTARIWQPSARIQRQNRQRQRFYDNDNAPARGGNARARRGDADDAGRRVASIARPLRQDVDERTGDGDRRARRREDSDDQSNATARRQSLSVRERTGQGDNVQARKWRAGASSVRANRSSDDDQPRRKFKKERSESFHSENRASNVNKHSRARRIERAEGGSRRAEASYSKPNKHEDGGGRKRGGGGHKSGKKGGGDSGKKEKKDKD